MDAGTVYFKTEKGRAEIAERSAGLTSIQRRLLIVIDGKKTVSELAALARIDEVPGAIEQLIRLRLIGANAATVELIEPVATGFSHSRSGEEPRAATSVPLFEEVRSGASGFVRERLGKSGEPICAAIDRCQNPEELRKMLRGVEIFIGQRLDADTTQAFARHFGQLLL